MGLLPTTFGKIGVIITVFIVLAWISVLEVKKKEIVVVTVDSFYVACHRGFGDSHNIKLVRTGRVFEGNGY